MEDMETLKDLKKVITKELKKNVEKGTMSPPEIDAVNKAVDALEKIVKIEKLCKEIEAMENGTDAYSGAFYNIRNFPSTPMHNVSPMSYGWEEPMTSGTRGRDANTGRYVSRDRYSGHSVNDRMIDALERMMETAASEFERQQILDKIKMIQNSPDRLG